MRQLTPREQEIVELVVKGLSTIEIGKELHISEHTVFSHKQNLFKKLEVTNSVALAMKAYVHSLVSQDQVNNYYKGNPKDPDHLLKEKMFPQNNGMHKFEPLE